MMRIGFDFDNTIVNYDTIFYTVAQERGLIPKQMPINKLAIRDHLRSINQESIWTEMQGYVYGARMHEAQSYPDAITVMKRLKDAGYTLMIISHKTKYPYLGYAYDLHDVAHRWIKKHLCVNEERLILEENVFFELTKDEKLARIKTLGCDIFMDDLPEILLASQFPQKTIRYLFDPEKQYQHFPQIQIVSSWLALVGGCFIEAKKKGG